MKVQLCQVETHQLAEIKQLAVALAEGLSLEDAISQAHAAAALSVQKLGAQSSIPRREETDYFLEEQLRRDK